MQILDNFLILALIVCAFIAGIKLANWYNNKALQEQKQALQRQFVRLQTRSDADDPCQPYISPYPTVGDCDGDGKLRPISAEFYNNLRKTGRAVTQFKRSDIAK